MYETMAPWEADPPWPPSRRSWPTSRTSGKGRQDRLPTTLQKVSTTNTRLERRSTPSRSRDEGDRRERLTVRRADLAAYAFNAGLVDECQLFIYPVLVGEGKPAFPSTARVQLELLEEHRFGNGVVNLGYRIQS